MKWQLMFCPRQYIHVLSKILELIHRYVFVSRELIMELSKLSGSPFLGILLLYDHTLKGREEEKKTVKFIKYQNWKTFFYDKNIFRIKRNYEFSF